MFGLLGVALGGERLAAAQVVQLGGEHHLIAGLLQQRTGLVDQRHLLGIGERRAHGARYAGGQVDHPRLIRLLRRGRQVQAHRLRHHRRPLRQAFAGQAAQPGAERGQARCAEQLARGVGGGQGQAGALQRGGEVAGQPVGGAGMPGFPGAQLAHQIPGVDPHRTALGAQAGGGAGVEAVVVVGLLQLRGVDAGALLRLDVAPDDDALARGKGQAVRRAHRLAEAALDALVDDLVGGR
ncbi:hypothetical protein D3C80_1425500 [compost metagenome]